MTDDEGPLIRTAVGLSASGAVVRERHTFREVVGQWSVARCTLLSLTTDLGEDDESLPMCPLCNVFLMADNLDVTRLGTDPDWRGL